MLNENRFNEFFDRLPLKKYGADCGAGEENKMEESEVKERKRKPNFSPLEVSIITESVKKHIDVIQSKLTNNITNKKKSQGVKITKEFFVS